jgi:hypothetical protein
MGPESILLSISTEGEGVYSFACPVCMEAVEKQADRKIVSLLVSAGVATAGRGTETIGLAREQAVAAAPALTMDDLIQFHFLLEDDSTLESFLGR